MTNPFFKLTKVGDIAEIIIGKNLIRGIFKRVELKKEVVYKKDNFKKKYKPTYNYKVRIFVVVNKKEISFDFSVDKLEFENLKTQYEQKK